MRDVGWEPVAFKAETNEIFLRADKCAGDTIDGRCCFACLSIETSIMYRDFVERAFNAKDHTPWKYLSSQQYRTLAVKLTKEIKRLRVQVCSQLHYGPRSILILAIQLLKKSAAIVLLHAR